MMDAIRKKYRDDGVVFLKGALNSTSLKLAEQAFEWSRSNPGPHAGEEKDVFRHDTSNPDTVENYRPFLTDPGIGDVGRRLFGDGRVWFMFEQIFLKEGAPCRRTPWHQDSSYFKVAGDDMAVLWINIDPVAEGESLEFVRGSHRGPTYNSLSFDPENPTAPSFSQVLPRLPDIQSDRGAWDIVSWGVEPGDVVAFHPAILHGGAATDAGGRRRTLSLRIFGEDVIYSPPQWADDIDYMHPRLPGLNDALRPGEPLRHPAFPQMPSGGGPLRESRWGDPNGA